MPWSDITKYFDEEMFGEIIVSLQKGVSLDIDNYCTVSLFFEQAYL